MDGTFKIILNKIFVIIYWHRIWVISMFTIITIAFLIAGYNWPKKYTSSTTIFIEEENILGPLMQGTAVQTDAVDRGRSAREIIFGRQIMLEILSIGRWNESKLTPFEQEKIMNEVIARTQIANVGQNLVRISYTDSEPERSYKVTKGYADLFIQGSFSAKVLESQAAFDFIDKQVKEYEKKLKESEDALKEFRNINADFRTGAAEQTSQRITEYRTALEAIEQQLREAKIRKSTLEDQLSGETETAAGLTRAEQLRSRIAEMQINLDSLRLSYHDTYPDIVQIKNQIEELRGQLEDEESRRIKAQKEAKKRGELYIDESIRANPVYQQLQGDLYETKTLIETLKVRFKETRKLLNDEIERDRRITAAETTLASLNRDYNVNQDVYQDLLRRRENARVSMSLDKDHQGLNLSINEPAFLPHSPSGPRFIHFVLAGIILGILMPIFIFYGIQQAFPRIYDATDIVDNEDIIVLGELSHFYTSVEVSNHKREIRLITLVFSLVIISIGSISIYKLLNI